MQLKYKILLNNEWCFGTLITPCWNWLGAKIPKGYGQTTYDGQVISTHRASWMTFRGPIPENMWVLHKCDNPSCVNPDHLYVGTPTDNVRDMHNRDRHAKGSSIGGAKLDVEKVREIKLLLAENRWSLEEIAIRFDVTLQNIHYIKTGKTWRHVNV